MNSFVAFDFETSYAKNACSIGLVEYVDGKLYREYYSLIKPKDLYFHPMNSRIHGIELVDVINEHEFDEVWEEIKDFFVGKILVAHNYSFDLSVLEYNLQLYSIPVPQFKILCTLAISRKYLDLQNYKLNTIANFFDVDQNKHHDALDDAHVCAQIFKGFLQFESINFKKHLKKISELNKHRFELKPIVKQSKGLKVINNVFEKYVITKSSILEMKKFVVSGIFTYFHRDELKQSIINHGGKVTSSVSKSTDYIIAGDKMGPAKREKAEKLGISIITEEEYLELIAND